MAKNITCPECKLLMSKNSKADCWLTQNSPVADQPPVYELNEFGKGFVQGLMESAAATGGSYNPTPREWTAKDLVEHDFSKVERDLFKMTVEDVILDFGCRVWEAV